MIYVLKCDENADLYQSILVTDIYFQTPTDALESERFFQKFLHCVSVWWFLRHWRNWIFPFGRVYNVHFCCCIIWSILLLNFLRKYSLFKIHLKFQSIQCKNTNFGAFHRKMWSVWSFLRASVSGCGISLSRQKCRTWRFSHIPDGSISRFSA